MKRYLFLCLCVGIALLAQPALAQEKNVTVVKATTTPTVDGKLSEFTGAPAIEVKVNEAIARARLLWDANALYLGINVTDTQINAFVLNRDGNIWPEDSVEFFFDVARDKGTSMKIDDYQFIVSALNTKLDSRGNALGHLNWNSEWQSAVVRGGTYNINTDTDTGYSIEMRIPWRSLGITASSTITEGMKSGFSMGLNDKDANGTKRMLWDGSTIGFRTPSKWGTLTLGAALPTGSTGDDDDDDDTGDDDDDTDDFLPPPPTVATPGQSKVCHRYTSSVGVPAGYGAAFNTQSTAKELLIQAFCDNRGIEVKLGNNNQNTYIYSVGYEWTGTEWAEIAFAGDSQTGSWYRGSAEALLSRSVAQIAQNNFFVTYICVWTGSGYKCGCRDAACATPNWQLQVASATGIASSTATETPHDDTHESGDDDDSEDEDEDEDDENMDEGDDDDDDTVAVHNITVEASNFEFSEDEIEVNAGDTVRLTFVVEEGTHDFVIDDIEGAQTDVLTASTSSVQQVIEFVAEEAGEFEFYCSVGQHRAMGMEGTFIVNDED